MKYEDLLKAVAALDAIIIAAPATFRDPHGTIRNEARRAIDRAKLLDKDRHPDVVFSEQCLIFACGLLRSIECITEQQIAAIWESGGGCRWLTATTADFYARFEGGHWLDQADALLEIPAGAISEHRANIAELIQAVQLAGGAADIAAQICAVMEYNKNVWEFICKGTPRDLEFLAVVVPKIEPRLDALMREDGTLSLATTGNRKRNVFKEAV